MDKWQSKDFHKSSLLVLRLFRDDKLVEISSNPYRERETSFDYAKEVGELRNLLDLEVKYINEQLSYGRNKRYLDKEDKRHIGVVCCEFKYLDGARGSLFLESVLSRPRILIFGAGHVGKAVARIGKIIGYDILLVDDRNAFFDDELNDMEITCINNRLDDSDLLRSLSVDEDTAIVVVTRGHQFDEACLRTILLEGISPDQCYIGMIGSIRRVEFIRKRLEAFGFGRELLNKVHAPIGLKIGAVTPEEIAISIIAEIVSKFRSAN